MSSGQPSWPRQTFEALYAASDDPWNFLTSDYEREKYRLTLASLGRRRFGSALEAGCSIGVLTRVLSERCDRLLAFDFAGDAVAAARARCAGRPGVRIEQRRLPDDWPGGRFDLIVLSEVLYFLDATDLRQAARRCAMSIRGSGVILLVNWTGTTNTPQTGDRAATQFIALLRGTLAKVHRLRRPGFRIDVLTSRRETE